MRVHTLSLAALAWAALLACGSSGSGAPGSGDAATPDVDGSVAASPEGGTPEGGDDGSAPTDGGDAGPGTDSSGGQGGEGGANPCGANLMTDAANCGACGHACLGGACTAGLCDRQPAAGTFLSVCSSSSVTPTFAGVDSTHLYVNCQDAIHSIRTSDMTEDLQIASVLMPPDSTLPLITNATLVGSSLYWYEVYNPGDGSASRETAFMRSPVAQNSAQILFQVGGSALAAGFDGTSVFYRNVVPGNTWLMRAGLDGSGQTSLGLDCGGLSTSEHEYAFDDTGIYCNEMGPAPNNYPLGIRVPKQGGTAETLATENALGAFWWFAVDSSRVYWMRHGINCTLDPVPSTPLDLYVRGTSGTPAKTIFVASPGATAGLLRASGGDVVWAAQPCDNTPAWVINSMGATASAPTVVARAQSHTTYQTTWESRPSDIAVDANWVYFVTDWYIWRVPR